MLSSFWQTLKHVYALCYTSIQKTAFLLPISSSCSRSPPRCCSPWRYALNFVGRPSSNYMQRLGCTAQIRQSAAALVLDLGATPNSQRPLFLPQSTVAVIDELRGQLSGTTAGCIEGSSTGGCQQGEAGQAQPNPAQSSGPAAPDVTDGRQGTHTAAGRAQTYTARAVHHKPAAAGPAGRSGSRQVHTAPDSSTQCPHRGVRSERVAAAQSSLFTPAATQCAVAQWCQHKVLQQEKAALSQQRQCLKEQQLLSQLVATEAAASVAHDQVSGRTGSVLPAVAAARLVASVCATLALTPSLHSDELAMIMMCTVLACRCCSEFSIPVTQQRSCRCFAAAKPASRSTLLLQQQTHSKQTLDRRKPSARLVSERIPARNREGNALCIRKLW